MAIVPEQALFTLRKQKTQFGNTIFGRYGFANAFNPTTKWVSPDVIGIDTGITLLSAANLLCEGVWTPFMQHPSAQQALKLAGFRGSVARRRHADETDDKTKA